MFDTPLPVTHSQGGSREGGRREEAGSKEQKEGGGREEQKEGGGRKEGASREQGGMKEEG